MIHQNLSAKEPLTDQYSQLFINLAALHDQKGSLRRLYKLFSKSDHPNKDLWLKQIEHTAEKVDLEIDRLNKSLSYGVL